MSERLVYELSKHARRRIARRGIEEQWVALALTAPDRVDIDRTDPALRHALKTIHAMDFRVLRVVYNSTTKPPRIVSAFFDRRLRGKI